MDRHALSSLGATTNVASWKTQQGWGSEDNNLDEWHGVTVDSVGRVSTVIVQDNKLSGSYNLVVIWGVLNRPCLTKESCCCHRSQPLTRMPSVGK